MRADLHRITLVFADHITWISGEYARCHCRVLVSTQHGFCKATALHLCELVDQHIAGGTDLTLEAEPAAQQKCLAESPAVAEFGEVQVNAFDLCQRKLARIVGIGKQNRFLPGF